MCTTETCLVRKLGSVHAMPFGTSCKVHNRGLPGAQEPAWPTHGEVSPEVVAGAREQAPHRGPENGATTCTKALNVYAFAAGPGHASYTTPNRRQTLDMQAALGLERRAEGAQSAAAGPSTQCSSRCCDQKAMQRVRDRTPSKAEVHGRLRLLVHAAGLTDHGLDLQMRAGALTMQSTSLPCSAVPCCAAS